MNKFNQYLKQYKKDEQLSYEKLSKLLKSSSGSIKQWISGKPNCQLALYNTLIRLILSSDAYGINDKKKIIAELQDEHKERAFKGVFNTSPNARSVFSEYSERFKKANDYSKKAMAFLLSCPYSNYAVWSRGYTRPTNLRVYDDLITLIVNSCIWSEEQTQKIVFKLKEEQNYVKNKNKKAYYV